MECPRLTRPFLLLNKWQIIFWYFLINMLLSRAWFRSGLLGLIRSILGLTLVFLFTTVRNKESIFCIIIIWFCVFFSSITWSIWAHIIWNRNWATLNFVFLKASKKCREFQFGGTNKRSFIQICSWGMMINAHFVR